MNFLSILLIILISFIFTILLGIILLPFFQKKKMYQSISIFLKDRHSLKVNTPTMGGILFIVPSIIIILILFLTNKIKFSSNVILVLITFFLYALLGFFDDYKKIKEHKNDGLSIIQKLLFQEIIAIIFYLIYMKSSSITTLTIFNKSFDIKWLYGIFILFYLVSITNAVNITDGLDGLCSGLCIITLLSYGIIALNRPYILGYKEISIICFLVSGSLLAFLFFNFYPAKIFMGDLGSLALGGLIGAIGIALKIEFSFLIFGFVFVLEVFSSLLQIIFYKLFKIRLFKKAPLHHHLEEKGMFETNIIKLLYLIAFVISLTGILLFILNL